MHRALTLATGSVAVLLLGACSSGPKTASITSTTEPALGVDAESTLDGGSLDFDSIVAELEKLPSDGDEEGPVLDEGPRVRRADPKPTVQAQPEPNPPEVISAAPADEVAPPAPPLPVVEPTREERVADLIAQLATVLGETESDSPSPIADAIRLLGLELVEPESAVPELAALAEQLAPAERATVEALTTLVRSLARSDDSADQAVVAAILQDAVKNLPEGDALRIPAMAICTRVDGFGSFRPFPTQTFVAGRTHRMIVYVEIGGFEQQPDTNGLWKVELTQELTLIQESDGLPALHIPAEVVRDRSVRSRRDFFTTRRIELPRNLSIGRYQLKVTVRDRLHGTAVAESTVPVELVANARSRGR